MKYRSDDNHIHITTDGGMEISFYFDGDHVASIGCGALIEDASPSDDDLFQVFVMVDGEPRSLQSLIDSVTDLMVQCRHEADLEAAAEAAEKAYWRSPDRYL